MNLTVVAAKSPTWLGDGVNPAGTYTVFEMKQCSIYVEFICDCLQSIYI